MNKDAPISALHVHGYGKKNVLETMPLIISLVLLLVFNVQYSGLRIFFVLALMLLPIFLLWKKTLPRNFILSLLISIGIVCFLLFCLLVNSNTFALSLSGSQGEIFAAMVSISFVFYLALMTVTSREATNVDDLFKNVLFVFTSILIIDVAVRYSQEPDCFLNYFCRKEAKTVGFFSTTNVTGVNVATVLATMIVLKRVATHKFIFSILNIILITTMARAAIVSYLFVITIYLIVKSHILIRLTALIFFIWALTFVATTNPYNILNDGSLLSKFDFLSQTIEIAEGATLLQLLFGFGASFDTVANILGVNGWSPHLPFLKAFFYFGILGLILYSLSIFICIIFGGKKFILPLLVNQIAAMAGGPMYSTTVTFSLFFVYVYRRRFRGR